MAKCDLCGCTCPAADMEQLLDSYKVGGVVDICPGCRKCLDKVKSDLLAEIAPRMREAISQRMTTPGTLTLLPAPLRQSWWSRLFGGSHAR